MPHIKPRQESSVHGFTLIELLVVISIIVLLLSLLAPAMDKAIYHAEMLQCAAQIKTMTTGVQTYAVGADRKYPARKAVASASPRIFAGSDLDDRPVLQSIFSVNSLLRDPFVDTHVDLENNLARSQVYGDYGLWFGFNFSGGGSAIKKLGGRWSWQEIFNTSTPINYKHSVLIGDMDIIYREPGGSFLAQSAHQDAAGQLQPVIADDTNNCFSHMRLSGSYKRDTLDLNFGFEDGSVERIDGIEPKEDERMATTPWGVYSAGQLMQIPKP